ncbi:substrate-binding domain-containing protein [Burkholderia multivorans]|uniref:substrate-binding domain-containing protein n=1 Tax=Burkholderia multivorans TaxID=87883 RepID=UPI0021BE4E81|nr:substrate-binding domain-containing protein [Burkholderia multivorans]
MLDATNRLSRFRLAVGPGAPSSRLSTLLALQRAEEPNIAVTFFETSGDDLVTDINEGRYDAGISLRDVDTPSVRSQPLWSENLAVALPLRLPLLDQAKLTISQLLDHSVFRWQAESCPLLDQSLSSLPPMNKQSMQPVTSFEMLALKVAAGYGLGISAQSRIERAHAWGITTRPLSDGPYEIVTYLQRPHAQADSVFERFERRAMEVARAGAA